MGKKKGNPHRYRKGKGGKGGGHPSSTAAAASTTDQTDNNKTKQTPILQRIRHGDARTRQAAMAVLLHATSGVDSNGDGIFKSTNVFFNPNNPTAHLLLQAVREQVMCDTDLDCSVTAAGCLANSLQQQSSSNSNNSTPLPKVLDEQAGWMILMVARLKHALEYFQQQQAENKKLTSASHDIDAPMQQQQQQKHGKKQKSGGTLTSQQQQQLKKLRTTILLLELAERCLQCIVSLLEDNPRAMDRMLQQSSNNKNNSNNKELSTLGHDCFTLILAWLEASTAELLTSSSKTADAAQQQQHNHGSTTTKEECLQSISILCSRAMHSALDDNPELVKPLLFSFHQSTQTVAAAASAPPTTTATALGGRILQTLKGVLDMTSNATAVTTAATFKTTTPTVTTGLTAVVDNTDNLRSSNDDDINATLVVVQLHCIGTWISLWQQTKSMSLSEGVVATTAAATAASLESHLSAAVVLLNQQLQRQQQQQDNYSQMLLEQLQVAYQAFRDQSQDDDLERQVVRAQSKKGESARAIARRLKKTPFGAEAETTTKSKKKNSTADGGETDPMATEERKEAERKVGDDDQEEEVETARGRLPEDRRDRQDMFEEALQVWTRRIQRPIQLALEITANLTATAAGEKSVAKAVDDDEIDDDDAMMDHEEDVAAATIATAIATLVVQHGIQESLLSLQRWLFSLDSPEPIIDSTDDLQGKSGLCVGHCLSIDQSSILTSSSPPPLSVPSTANLWNDLQNCFQNAAGPAGRQGISSAMVLALRHRPEVRTSLEANHLEFIFGLLIMDPKTTTTKNDEDKDGVKNCNVLLVRDAVTMLGILCQEDHSIEVNERVCQALIHVLENRGSSGGKQTADPLVVAEALNVLMDLYSEDDCHPVFHNLKVLKQFQTSLPPLQRMIAAVSNSPDVDPDTLEEWREIALNAGRFIHYKKGLRSPR